VAAQSGWNSFKLADFERLKMVFRRELGADQVSSIGGVGLRVA